MAARSAEYTLDCFAQSGNACKRIRDQPRSVHPYARMPGHLRPRASQAPARSGK